MRVTSFPSFKLLFFLGIFFVGTASGQSLPSGSNTSSGSADLPTTRQEQPSFTEIMGSLGRYLTDELRSFVGGVSQDENEWDSNASPRASVSTFVDGMEEILYLGGGDTGRVNQTLPPGFSADSPEAIALKSIFDRLGPIPDIDLPGSAAVEETGIRSFEVFPYAIDHEWIWTYLDETPTAKVTLVSSSNGDEWRFSTETLDSAPQLAKSLVSIPPIYPSSSEKNLALRIFAPMFEDSPWWSWGILGASFVLAYLVGRYVRRGVNKLGGMLVNKVSRHLGSIMNSIAVAIAIVAGTLVVIIGSSFVTFSPIVADMVWMLIRSILLLALIWMLFALTDLVAKFVRRRFVSDDDEYGDMAVTVIQRAVSALLSVVLIIFILENVLGMHIGALITGLGIVGLALSLAGKETAQNLFGAVSIFVNRPFVVGDWIDYKDEIGEVIDVKMQTTQIRLLSGEVLIVPNMQFISNEVQNLAMRKYLRREMNISLTYHTPARKIDEAIALLEEILRSDEIVEDGNCNLEDYPPLVTFSAFEEYYFNIKVYYWYFIGDKGEQLQRNSDRGWFTYLEHCSVVNKRILEAFNTHEIEFAFPTQTIELQKEPDPKDQAQP